MESVVENIPKSPADTVPWHGSAGRGGGWAAAALDGPVGLEPASLDAETSPSVSVCGGGRLSGQR